MSVDVTGMPQIIRALRQITDVNQLRGAMEGASQLLLEEAKRYPSPPPGSQYVRTYALRDNWQYSKPNVSGNTIQSDIFNTTPYGAYVVGATTQARIHQGRWKTTEEIANEQAALVADVIEAAVERIIR